MHVFINSPFDSGAIRFSLICTHTSLTTREVNYCITRRRPQMLENSWGTIWIIRVILCQRTKGQNADYIGIMARSAYEPMSSRDSFRVLFMCPLELGGFLFLLTQFHIQINRFSSIFQLYDFTSIFMCERFRRGENFVKQTKYIQLIGFRTFYKSGNSH